MIKLFCLIIIFAINGVISVLAQGNPEAPKSTVDEQIAALKSNFEQHPDVTGLTLMMGPLGNISKADDDKKAEAKQLATDAATFLKSGNSGEARRRLSHAITILLGGNWDESQEFGISLALRTDNVVSDLNNPFLLSLSQNYTAQYAVKKGFTLQFSIAEANPRIANDVPFTVTTNGKPRQTLPTIEIPTRDLIDDPVRISIDLKSVSEGSYLLFADLFDGEIAIAHIATPIYLAKDIQARRRAIEAKSAKVKNFNPNSSTMTTIRYPFELADNLNARRFEITSFDFAGQMKRSEELMNALASGKDLLTRAKGDTKRNYWFADANEIMPYRLFVPKSWDGKKQLPLIIALHGGGLDENNMLDRGDGIMDKLAEQYGYIVAAPLGYRVANGGFTLQPTATQTRFREFGDLDIMNVMENVAAEYGVDRSRIYIMGNSAGAGRTWNLVSKYGEKFAGLAPCASSASLKNTSFEKFKNMPVLACVGDLDTETRKDVAKFGVAKVKEISEHAEYLEVKGGTHGTAIQMAMPQIFEFFNKYKKPIQ